jgi:hypothetical protein
MTIEDDTVLLHSATAGEDYPWIRAFAAYIDTDRSWLARQLTLARETMAPVTACRKNSGERWMTLEDIADPPARAWIIDWGADYSLHIPDRVLKVWTDPAAAAARSPLRDLDLSLGA